MTFRPVEDASAAKQKVNYDARALLGIEPSAGALLRREQATAGGSDTIDDRSISPFDYSIDLTSPLMFFGHGSTTPTTPVTLYEGASDEELLSLVTARSMGKVLGTFGLGTGLRMNYGPNSESVVEHLVPTTLLPVNVDPVADYRRVRREAVDGRRDALEQISRDLDRSAAIYAQESPQDVIRRLTDFGVSQLVMARALGVTPTAVRKWTRGEAAKADHRGRLASFAAMYARLMEAGVHDPAGWLDIPISSQSTLTALDLFIEGRPDLAVLYGARLMEPHEALDAFDPAWRETYPVDPDYEVVMLRDGSRSAVPRRGGAA